MKTDDTFEKNEGTQPESASTSADSGTTVRRTRLRNDGPPMNKRARNDWQDLAASLKK